MSAPSSPQDADYNKTTEFLHGRGFFPFYVLLLIISRWVVFVLTTLVSESWGKHATATTHIIHSVVRSLVLEKCGCHRVFG